MKFILILIISLLSFGVKSQNVAIKITRSEYSDIVSDVEKYAKECSKDIKIKHICKGERIIVFEILSEKYKDPNDLVISLELEFLYAEFFIKTKEELGDSKCKEFLGF